MSDWVFDGENGFARGPNMEIVEDGRRVAVEAVWSDEDGVCVSVDTGDEPLPAGLAWKVSAAMVSLASTPAPANSAT